jgi:hypothetical protein
LTPPSAAVAAVQPPHRTLPETVLAAWRTATQTPVFGPGFAQPFVPADNPPFGLDVWLPSTLAQWQVAPWTQQRSTGLIQAAVTAAAQQPPRRTLPETILAAWRVSSMTPLISGWRVQEYVPDNPPFGLDPWLTSALAQWQTISQPQQRTARLIQAAIAAAVANPPFDQSWFWGVINQWQAIGPVLQARKLSPGIPGQSVDKPPNRAAELRATLVSWQPPPLVQISYARLIQAAIAAAADNPPFGIVRPYSALGQWQARTLTKIEQALVVPEFIASVVNDPPFGMPPDWLYQVLTTAWKPGDPLPKQLQKILQGAPPAVVNNPPFGMPPRWYAAAISAWIPPPPLPRQKGPLSPGIPGLSVDNPTGRIIDLRWSKESSWIITNIDQVAPLIQPPAVVNNPPFGMPPDWLYSVLTAAWKPGEPLPKLLQKILQAGPPPVIAHGQKWKRKWRRGSS